MLKKKSAYTVAILGATGAVGKESLEIPRGEISRWLHCGCLRRNAQPVRS